MNFINPPAVAPKNVTHGTFYSNLIGCEIGYNIYLPPDHEKSGARFPAAYHLHGYKGNESAEIWLLEKAYRSVNAITVFANGTGDNGYRDAALPIESVIIGELIPFIDTKYKTNPNRENRSVSGFSMGGAGAFYYAVKYPEMFGSVTAYAGTYHHFYHKDYRGVAEPPEKAASLYEAMMNDAKYFEKDGILYLVKQNAEKIRGRVNIRLHIGTDDILFCDNEIMHLYLNSLNIPHEYKVFKGAGHDLDKIL